MGQAPVPLPERGEETTRPRASGSRFTWGSGLIHRFFTNPRRTGSNCFCIVGSLAFLDCGRNNNALCDIDGTLIVSIQPSRRKWPTLHLHQAKTKGPSCKRDNDGCSPSRPSVWQ